MMNDNERKAFERWHKDNFERLDNLPDTDDWAYEIWQAAINSIPAVSGEAVAYKHETFINGRCKETWYDDIKHTSSDTVITPLYLTPQDQSARIAELEEALKCLLPGLILDLRYADKENDDLEAMQSRIDTVQEALANIKDK